MWLRKIDFLYPEGKKNFVVVMPFGPKNEISFYTAMMKIFHDEWIIIFNSTKDILPSNASAAKIFWDRKTIIDNILIYFNHILILFHYFFLALKSLLNIGSFSRWANVISSCLTSNILDMIYPQTVIVLLGSSLILLNNIQFNHMVCPISLLLVYIHSTMIMSHDLNQT